MGVYNLDMDQAEDFELTATLKTKAGGFVDLTGATGAAQVRRPSDGAILASFDLSFASDRTTGQLTLSLPNDKIKLLAATKAKDYSVHAWDLRLIIGGKKRKYMYGGVSVVFAGPDNE